MKSDYILRTRSGEQPAQFENWGAPPMEEGLCTGTPVPLPRPELRLQARGVLQMTVWVLGRLCCQEKRLKPYRGGFPPHAGGCGTLGFLFFHKLSGVAMKMKVNEITGFLNQRTGHQWCELDQLAPQKHPCLCPWLSQRFSASSGGPELSSFLKIFKLPCRLGQGNLFGEGEHREWGAEGERIFSSGTNSGLDLTTLRPELKSETRLTDGATQMLQGSKIS